MKDRPELVIALVALTMLASCDNTATRLAERGKERVLLGNTTQPGFANLLARADAYYDANQFTRALSVYQQAESLPGVSGTDALKLTHKIGLTQIKLRRFDEAMASFDRGLDILAQAPAPVQMRVGPILRQARGEALRGMGQPANARKEYELASSAYQALADELFVARMQVEIGSTYVDEANFSEALLHYEDARRRLEAIRSPALGRLLVNMGSLLTWLGKYDEALALQAQAERACVTQGDVTCEASVAHAQGFTRYQQGDYEAAAAASRRAVKLFGDMQQVERARALNNLGLSLIALNRTHEALDVLQAANALFERAAGNTKDKATVIDSLATAYRDLGDNRTANRLYQNALLLWRVAGYREGERDTLANLGQLAVRMHQPALSVFYYKLSVNLAQSLRADAKRLEPGYLDTLTRRLSPSYLALAGVLVDEGRLVEAHQVMRMLKEQELFDFLRRGGPAGNTRAELTGQEPAQLKAYEERQQPLFKLTRELETLGARPSDTLTPADRVRIVELQAEIQNASDDFERFLAALSHDLAQADRAPIVIRDDQLVRLQHTLDVLGRRAVILHYVPLPDRLNIILTASQAQAMRHYTVQVREKDLDRAIYRFREQIQYRDPDVRKTAAQLYGWLMPHELRKDLEDVGAKILMVSSAENLRYLPFSALYDGHQWLAERYPVTMFDDAVTDALKDAPHAHWSVHAFGMTQATGGYPALAWVRNELNAIIGTHGLPGTADFDGQFTLDRLRDALNQRHPPVLHIASHFVFRPGTEDDSFLLLGVGRLTLTDVKRMKFGGLDLLTLSACETAMSGGVNRNGLEVESFAALAQARGASAVLATLWSVDDISTAAFMQRFYLTRRTSNVTKVEALQAAQVAMIRRAITPESARATLLRSEVRGTVEKGMPASADYSHPFYWAPFVLSGNWR